MMIQNSVILIKYYVTDIIETFTCFDNFCWAAKMLNVRKICRLKTENDGPKPFQSGYLSNIIIVNYAIFFIKILLKINIVQRSLHVNLKYKKI